MLPVSLLRRVCLRLVKPLEHPLVLLGLLLAVSWVVLLASWLAASFVAKLQAWVR